MEDMSPDMTEHSKEFEPTIYTLSPARFTVLTPTCIRNEISIRLRATIQNNAGFANAAFKCRAEALLGVEQGADLDHV